jgi:hypothetical protein
LLSVRRIMWTHKRTHTAWPAGIAAALLIGATSPAGAQTTTTTSTTLPPEACIVDASFTSLDCRAAELGARLDAATDLGKTAGTLQRQAGKFDRLLAEADAFATLGEVKKANTKLKRAGRVLKSMGFRIRSLNGRRNIPDATRVELQETVTALDADVKALRGTM